MSTKIKVLYIAGPSRSGSTVLSNLLGEVEGFFNAGELIDIWDRGIETEGRCGCGVHISECGIWHTVLDRMMATPNHIDVQLMIRQRDDAAHSRKVLWYMGVPGASSRLKSQLRPYTRALEMLYNAIGDVTGSQVIVDPSKNAGYAYILSMLPGIDLYILHLVRDPRATAYSWLRKKVGLRREKPVKSVLEWSVRNMVAEGIGHISPKRYQRLRYEDFVKRPVETSKRILDFLEKPNLDLPFVSDHEAALGVNHTIYGNPNRFHSGLVKIKLDDAWQTIRKTDKAIIVALTWPFLFQYGYPIMVRRHTRSHDAHEFNEISADHEQIN